MIRFMIIITMLFSLNVSMQAATPPLSKGLLKYFEQHVTQLTRNKNGNLTTYIAIDNVDNNKIIEWVFEKNKTQRILTCSAFTRNAAGIREQRHFNPDQYIFFPYIKQVYKERNPKKRVFPQSTRTLLRSKSVDSFFNA